MIGEHVHRYAFNAITPELALMRLLLPAFIAAVVSLNTGSAFAPICVATLVHPLSDPVRLVATIIMAGIMIQIFVVITLRREIEWAGNLIALPGEVTTLRLGVLLRVAMTGCTTVLVLGTMLIAYALWMLWRSHAAKSTARPRWANAIVRIAGGITDGFAGFPAGPLAPTANSR